MANIFSVFGTILVDNTKANKSIDDTTKKAEDSSKGIGGAFTSIAKGAAAVGTAVVAGASAVGGAAFKMASDTAAAADEVDKTSQKLGMSREAYQEWDYVLSQSGVEITSMTTGLKTLTNKIDDAKNGSKSATEMFNKLGVSMNDLQSMSREEAFDAVIKGMQGMEDSTERAALANDLFGRSGQELTALFNQTAESTEQLKNKAHELGMIMSDETIDSGVVFTDTIDTIKRSLSGAANSLGGTVLPIVQTVLNFIVERMPTIQALINQLSPVITSVFGNLLPPLFNLAETLFPVLINLISTLLPPIQTIITSLLPVVTDLITMLLPPITQIIQMLLPLLINLITPLLPLLQPIFQLLQPFIDLLLILLEPLTQLLNMILPPLISLISKIISVAIVPLQAALEMLASIIGSVVTTAFDNIKVKIETVKTVFSNIIDFVKNVFYGNWSAAWENVKNIFISIFDGFKERVGNIFNGFIEVIKAPVNAVIKIINKLIEAVNSVSFEIPDWVPEWGGKTFGLNLKPIQLLAKGTIVDEPTPAIVGEDGAEAVIPLEKNTEWIDRLASDLNSKMGSDADSIAILKEILAEIKALRRELFDIIVSALVDGVSVEWKERELMRLIKAYAS